MGAVWYWNGQLLKKILKSSGREQQRTSVRVSFCSRSRHTEIKPDLAEPLELISDFTSFKS
jgi:hypothetical protein